ncbi:hypothetical protein IC619_000980 [Hazenella sp. IB182353]|uniref:sporulation protein YpjB n=1 Tax=Polycladospora coralii TaxID=2771432 RepID=UPI001747C40A|nr:sporulation protein YpjB [Polycladospora coralii]MBS7529066.1 hypothetical protein [Polycladospora coralii]
MKCLITFMAWFHLFGGSLSPAFEQENEDWLQRANSVAAAVEQEDYETARTKLKQLSHRFSQSQLADQNLTVRSIRELADVIVQLENHLNQLRPNPSAIREATWRLQFAFDAVANPNQPLWKEQAYDLQSQLKKVKEAISTGDQKKIKRELDRLDLQYQRIRPALLIAKSPQIVNHVEGLLRFLRSDEAISKKMRVVEQLEDLMSPIFHGSEQEVYAAIGFEMLSIKMIALTISVVVAGALAYISLKNYRHKVP